MHPLDKENLAFEDNLMRNDPYFRVESIDRPPAPNVPFSRSRTLHQRADGIWSKCRYNYDSVGLERACATHADGHSIMWTVLDPTNAFLITPEGAIIHTPAGYAEARAYAAYWGAP